MVSLNLAYGIYGASQQPIYFSSVNQRVSEGVSAKETHHYLACALSYNEYIAIRKYSKRLLFLKCKSTIKAILKCPPLKIITAFHHKHHDKAVQNIFLYWL